MILHSIVISGNRTGLTVLKVTVHLKMKTFMTSKVINFSTAVIVCRKALVSGSW